MIITCIILLIIGAVAISFALGLINYFFFHNRKDEKPHNKVRFFVKRYHSGFELLIRDKYGSVAYICDDFRFKDFNLNVEDFKDLKCNKYREVFINLED